MPKEYTYLVLRRSLDPADPRRPRILPDPRIFRIRSTRFASPWTRVKANYRHMKKQNPEAATYLVRVPCEPDQMIKPPVDHEKLVNSYTTTLAELIWQDAEVWLEKSEEHKRDDEPQGYWWSLSVPA